MAHVQGACHVWRWYYKGISRTFVDRGRREIPLGDPELIPLFFYALRIKALV